MKKTSNFDRIAFAYDFLVRLVFGRSIQASQQIFLDRIPSDSRVLIIGGGTGWIIPALQQASVIDELVYLEASAEMIRFAKEKTKKEWLPRTTFILGTEKNIPALGSFDVVITFFFLDLFSPTEYPMVADLLYSSLKPEGIWLISDFDHLQKKYWQRTLVNCMFVFFRVVSNVRAKALGNTDMLFKNLNMTKTNEQFFFHDMIYARLYKKREKEVTNNYS